MGMRLVSLAVLLLLVPACGEVKPPIFDGPQPIDAGEIDAGDAGNLVTLTVDRTGAGAVTSSPSGLSCGAGCSAQFPIGAQVTLTAVADAGNTFSQWSGACSGASPSCTITLGADTTVGASFAPAMVRVSTTLVGNGVGTVIGSPAAIGINCPTACTALVPYDTALTLTATPSGSSLFVGWSGGACTGVGPCTFNVTTDVTINAAFAQNYTLIVTRTGNGSGAVASSPAGITCGADCDETYTANATVTLSATADPSSTFTGWTGGGCSGTAPCVVTMDAAKAVAAQFTLRRHPLTATTGGTGIGTVTSNPIGITCGSDCSEQFDHGTMVALTATAGGNSAFTGWTGACSGVGACIVTMDMARTVGANFTLNSLSLSVSKTGAGNGTVTSTPVGIACGATCTAPFAAGTMVTLSAVPQTGSGFSGWSGGGCSGTGACTVTLNASTTVTATFYLENFTITITKTGTGAGFGTITSAPTGISCGADCTQNFEFGSAVTLTANGGAGSTFGGWPANTGCTGTAPCTFTVTDHATFATPFTLANYTVTAVVAGNGIGTVTSSPAGINCPGTCTRSSAYNSTVTLTATPAANHTFAGWTGGCTGVGACTLTVTGNVTATATFNPPPNIAFVTSSTHTGNLGGLVGADAICQARAQANALPGSYRAWLSTATVDAIDRLGTASGWVRTDGRPFVNSRSDLANARIFYPLLLNERGSPEVNDAVWTGTSSNGTANTSTCTNWTSAVDTASGSFGFGEYGTGAWTQNGGGLCSTTNHLYCFGINYTATVAPPPVTAVRRAFVSNAPWLPNSGLASADALCNSEASAASLPGTYRALIATATATAASRFSTVGNPWARVDDVLLAPTAANFLASTGTHWLAPLSVSANRFYSQNRTWAGAPNLTTTGTAPTGLSTSCQNWSSASATSYGHVGISGSSRILTAFANYTGQSGISECANTQHKILCLQQ